MNGDFVYTFHFNKWFPHKQRINHKREINFASSTQFISEYTFQNLKIILLPTFYQIFEITTLSSGRFSSKIHIFLTWIISTQIIRHFTTYITNVPTTSVERSFIHSHHRVMCAEKSQGIDKYNHLSNMYKVFSYTRLQKYRMFLHQITQ